MTTNSETMASPLLEDNNNNNNNPSNNSHRGHLQTDYISLRSHTNISRLARSIVDKQQQLYANTERLIVVCPGCEPDWSEPEVQTLFDAIGQLQALKELKLNCVGLLDVAFPVRLLTQILHACPTLQKLDLDDVALSVDSAAEVAALVEAIRQRQPYQTLSTTTTTTSNATSQYHQQQQPLKYFRLFGCLANDTLQLLENGSLSLDPLWASLCAQQRVEVDAVDDGLLGTIAASSVQKLSSSSTLQTLHLNGFVLDNDCLAVMAEALTTNTTLVDLSFDLYSLDHPGKGAFALAEALRHNQQVEKLHLSISHAWNDDTFLHAMAAALATDCTLKSFILGTCAKITDATAQAFAEMTVSNHMLEVLQISTYHGKWKPIYLHYTKLNRQHRGYFHSNFGSLSREEWVHKALWPVIEEVNSVFYFLKMNPMLCCPHSTTTPTPITTKQTLK